MSRKSASESSAFNSSWSNCSSDNETGVLAKLRRLKIQESLFLQNINKIMLNHYDNNGDEFITSDLISNYKQFISNLKNSYCEIKNLFDSLKCNTTSNEALKSCDIDDIKSDVLEIETKIKKFKNTLSSEQTLLKSQELELVKEMNALTENSIKIIKYPKIKAKPFSDIVPSPVKNIIISPFKCQEVQQFQDFLKNHHRNGGWNEYSHNIFVQSWNKHFQVPSDYTEKIDITEIENSSLFLSEITEKLPGVTNEDIIQHSIWYLDYLHLKRRQQEALNKWKAKKKIIMKSQLKNKGGNCAEKNKQFNDRNKEKIKKITRHVNFVVSDEIKRIQEMFCVELDESASTSHTESPVQVSESSIMRNNYVRIDNFMRPGTSTGLRQRTEKPRGLMHFAKSTQQWTNMCNDKKQHNIDFSTWIPQLENIEKLCVPKWRICVNDK